MLDEIARDKTRQARLMTPELDKIAYVQTAEDLVVQKLR
ncbi:MAG: hypothetical protein RJB11_2243 [Planctomycetota bacterium]|jgi:hypothetical protein